MRSGLNGRKRKRNKKKRGMGTGFVVVFLNNGYGYGNGFFRGVEYFSVHGLHEPIFYDLVFIEYIS